MRTSNYSNSLLQESFILPGSEWTGSSLLSGHGGLMLYDRRLYNGDFDQNLLVEEPDAAYAHRYIDPLDDHGFKHLFGKEAHKDVPMDFLNELFRGQERIRDLQFHPTERPGPVKNIRKVIVDLLCTDDRGNQFVIEMQRANQEYFTNRIDYYTSRQISDQLPPGEIGRKFPLHQVNFIGVLNFCLPGTPPDIYVHTIQQTYMEAGIPFPSKRAYKLIELVKFNKREDELTTGLDQWLYFLRNLRRLRHQPSCLDKPIFEKVFKIGEIANLTKEDLRMFSLQSPLQDQCDLESAIAYGKRTAREEGLKEGLKEGVKTKGRAVVQALIRETNFDDRKIAALADVSEMFVKNQRANLNAATI